MCCLLQNTPRVLCGAVQELHRCLTPLTREGQSARSWNFGCGEEGPHDPSTIGRASSLRPWAEEWIGLPAPDKLPTFEPEEAAYSDELALVGREKATGTPGVYPFMADESEPPSKGLSLASQYTQWAKWDLSSLDTLQVIVSHNTMMGEVPYKYKSMVASTTSLQLNLPESSNHPDSPNDSNNHEWSHIPTCSWGNRPLLNPWMNSKSSEYPLLKWNRAKNYWLESLIKLPICAIDKNYWIVSL